MAWLVTPSNFHPDQHSVTQSVFMLPLYFLESAAKSLSFTSIPVLAYDFQFSLAALALNLLSLISGFYFIQQITNILAIRPRPSDYVLIIFGTALFYFSFLQATVVEILAFPMLSYLLFAYFQMKSGQLDQSPIALGLVTGFLAVTKITFWPACLLFCVTYFRRANKPKAAFTIAMAAILAFAVSNQYLKYNRLLFDMAPPINSFLNFSFDNFSRNLFYGFFPHGGLFFANPLYFFGIIGFVLLLLQLKNKISFVWPDFFILVGWFFLVFFGHIFIGGYIVEDHLPGRIHLAFLPMLILGFIYLRNLFNKRYALLSNIFFVLCCLWHLLITLSYVVQIQGSSFNYATNMVPTFSVFLELLPNYLKRVQENASGIAAHFFHIIIFSILITLLVSALLKSSIRTKFVPYFILFAGLTFGIMSILNFHFAPLNAAEMSRKSSFSGMAVGNGIELLQIDYTLQLIRTLKTRCSPTICAQLDAGLNRYYSKVTQQIVRSTPELDRAVLENSSDFSFWIKMEQEKSTPAQN